MASRVTAFGKRPDEVEVLGDVVGTMMVNERVPVTPDMLNEAVEQTLETTDPRHAHNMRLMWSMDANHEAARMYFADQVRQRLVTPFSEVAKFTMRIDEALTQEQTNKIIEYAPEFNFTFQHTVSHDHPFFSARRKVDNQILLSQFPSSMSYIDFGGSVVHAINMSQTRCTVVAPFDIDPKDATRRALTMLRLKQIAGDANRTNQQREMAMSVLRGDGKYHRSERAQESTAKALVSIANHVYDVPIQDWPHIMNRCGVQVHEGCMHFSNDFFEKEAGDIEYSGSRFEVDRIKDEFRMRIGGSSARWYVHRWSDFLRYGANQVLHSSVGTYSYQICERRADTIRYRILKVDSDARVDQDQVYCLPDVPMVEVYGFKVGVPDGASKANVRSNLQRHKYTFPYALWERMLTYAKGEVERGGLSYEKLYNHYRTVVPRNSINTVLIGGGQSVPMDEVPALVIHAAIVAHSDILLVQRAIRHNTDQVQAERSLYDESTLVKMYRTFLDAVVALGCLPFSLFSGVQESLGSAYLALVKDMLVMWRPQVRLKSLNMALLLDAKVLSYKVQTPTQINFRTEVAGDKLSGVVDVARVDPDVAAGLLRVCGQRLTPTYRHKLETLTAGSSTGDVTDSSATVVADQSLPNVSYFDKGVKKIRRTVLPQVDDALVVRERRLAIQEAINECNLETRTLTATCQRIWREIVVNGKPVVHAMHQRKEEYYNPDLWFVRDGLLVESVLSKGVEGTFQYSGVFLPSPDSTGAYIVPIVEERYVGPNSATGEMVDRVHIKLPVAYTGYVMVLDGMKVFNGPAMVDTLERALHLEDKWHNYKVICHQGPPGCGKTTQVAKDGDPSNDVFLVPTRIAMEGLREKLKENHKVSERKVSTVCRTLDSLLVNYGRLSADAKRLVNRVLIDEYVLAPSGKWYAAAALLGVSEVHAYGDSKQINHKPRVEINQLYANLTPQVLENEFVTFRCAPKILTMFNYVYNNEIRSANKSVGEVHCVKDVKEVQWMQDCRVLTMYQADKKTLHNMLAHMKPKPTISTTHEGQGSDCDQVVLFNFETRRRGVEDTHYLYGQLEYALVAASRCRVSFYYVKLSGEPDKVTEMIANAANLEDVQRCSDLDTQGQSF